MLRLYREEHTHTRERLVVESSPRAADIPAADAGDDSERLNDTFGHSIFGHSIGDELLSVFGRFPITHTRAEDFVCRYGGEEFVLIFPDMTIMNGGRISAILSAGVATFPSDAPTAEALIRAADAALYRAKSDGRDRIAANRGGAAIGANRRPDTGNPDNHCSPKQAVR
jgi:predicted signal transduction protein with EAL and GGDEF domain